MKTQKTPPEPLLASDSFGLRWRKPAQHKNLGEVFITLECLALQIQNSDPSSIFVEHDGEVKEVSRAMMVKLNTDYPTASHPTP